MELMQNTSEVTNVILDSLRAITDFREAQNNSLVKNISEHIVSIIPLKETRGKDTTTFEHRLFVCSYEEGVKLKKQLAKQNRIIQVLWQDRKDKQWKSKLPE